MPVLFQPKKMETFVPAPRDGPVPGAYVLLGDPSPLQRKKRATPKGCVERLQTIALFHAAKLGTGCRSAYELEQRMGPDALQPGQLISEWSETRQHVWDWWERGGSTVAFMRRNAKPALEPRLAAVRECSPLPDEVLGMAFWRYLDPQPLTVAELVPPTAGAAEYARHHLAAPLGSNETTASLAKRLLCGLAETRSRYDAMSGLWLRLRSSNWISALGYYALSYLCWLKARLLLEKDPVFGPLAAELYDYTHHESSCLALTPATELGLKSAVDSLYRCRLEPSCSGRNSWASLPTRALGPLLRKPATTTMSDTDLDALFATISRLRQRGPSPNEPPPRTPAAMSRRRSA